MKVVCTLSILFTLTVLGGLGYLYFVDPFGINSLLFPEKISVPANNQNIDNNVNNSGSVPVIGDDSGAGSAINLSADQKASLEKIGVDPSTIPSTISPEVERCFMEKLGQARVNEIKAGASPSVLELLKAKPCLE